jgi:hypothetical protein
LSAGDHGTRRLRASPNPATGDVVAQAAERVARLGAQARLGLEQAGRVRVRPERIGEASRGDARGLDSLLRRHAVGRDVEEHLEHGLLLDVAAGRAERHERAAVAEHHGRRGREPRPLAGSHDARVSG